MSDPRAAISEFVATHRDDAIAFLVELVKTPSDNPPGVAVEVRRVPRARRLVPIVGQERLVVAAIRRNARAVLGEDIRAHGVPLYTDARDHGASGVPAVLYVAGARTLAGAKGRRADENLKLNDLRRATEEVALSLYDLPAGGGA